MQSELAQAEQARALVNTAPELARDRAAELLTVLTDPEARSVAERAYAQAVKELGDVSAAVRHLRRAISIADRAGMAERAAEARTSLVVVLVERGETAAALYEADLAAPALRGSAAGRLLIQRSLVLQRMGRLDDAVRGYREALPLVRQAGDVEYESLALLRRGTLYAYQGNHARAVDDLNRCAQLAQRHGLPLIYSFALHNLGFAAFMRGDLPDALARIDASAEVKREIGRPDAVTLTDRAAVLVAAGLGQEAVETAQLACAQLERDQFASDLAEARLSLASAALLNGDTDLAALTAAQGGRDFARQHRTPWATLARHVEVSARWAAGERTAALLRLTRRVAVDLVAAGWPVDAVQAHTLAGQLGIELNRHQIAMTELELAARCRSRGPAQLRAAGWHAEALRRLERGDPRGALAALRAGLDILAEHAATLGATDLRVHAGVHGEDMGALGVRLAIEGGRGRTVLAWAERRRAGALRRRPVRPPNDIRLADDLAELRRISAAIEEAGLAGRSTRTLHAKRIALENAIKDRSRHARGSYAPDPPFDLSTLVAALGKRALVEFVRNGDRLHAVTVADSRVRLTELGSFRQASAEAESLRFSLNRIARRHGGPQLIELARQTARHAAITLDRLLLGPLAGELGDRDLVLLPTGVLHALPWPVLPSCAGRPVVVAPSATSWVRTMAADGAGSRRILLAAGPALEHAEPEIRTLAERYPQALVLTGADATAAAVANGLDGANLAHVAAHGIFRSDNAQFSNLRLADGPLTVYDLERLSRAPRTLVLSACDSALSTVRPGDELMGLAGAVFALGTRTLIASVTPIHDEETRAVMLALHDRLLTSASPARALADASQATGIDGFVCFGAG
ncbi:MAG TPA: CHAT domain-containing tetratricopeptide repeat protein [Actinomycetes bacterium]|nr:CHAT domain-containing tetratricopeptide repeat protein [Actinomycetes bacterium]